jgi:hypothetical protein
MSIQIGFMQSRLLNQVYGKLQALSWRGLEDEF